MRWLDPIYNTIPEDAFTMLYNENASLVRNVNGHSLTFFHLNSPSQFVVEFENRRRKRWLLPCSVCPQCHNDNNNSRTLLLFLTVLCKLASLVCRPDSCRGRNIGQLGSLVFSLWDLCDRSSHSCQRLSHPCWWSWWHEQPRICHSLFWKCSHSTNGWTNWY